MAYPAVSSVRRPPSAVKALDVVCLLVPFVDLVVHGVHGIYLTI